MAGPADPIADPVYVLETCLRERSGGSMIAALGDVWHMARHKSFTGDYHEAHRLLVGTGRYHLAAEIGGPVVVRPTT